VLLGGWGRGGGREVKGGRTVFGGGGMGGLGRGGI